MTNVAVMPETLPARRNVLRGSGKRILSFPVADKEPALRRTNDPGLPSSRGIRFYSPKRNQGNEQNRRNGTTDQQSDGDFVHWSLLFDHVDLQRHRAVTLAAEMRAFSQKLPGLGRRDRDLRVFTLFDLGPDIQLRQFETVSDIR